VGKTPAQDLGLLYFSVSLFLFSSAMRINDAQPQAGSKRRRRRVGRGISAGQGASCGFGMRGQKSRSGSGTRPGFEGGQMPLYRRVPKLKHFPLVNQKEYTIINVKGLSALEAGTEVSLESLLEAGILTTNDGPLKVLGDGELTTALTVRATAFTQSAKEKIEQAGGTWEVVA
jgi:large subunit ribosomal protein L15